jgi:hypothetical protein
MNALVLAKRRVARRRREDGAVMFIVAMTLAVLASVGIYALAAAATEVRTSGNERQNTQTHYLAQYGILGAAREMSGSRALFTVRVMKTSTTQDKLCVSLPGVPAGSPQAACIRMGSGDLANNGWGPTLSTYGSTTAFANGVPPGSFGSMPMNGDFFVELTEPMQLADPARYSTNVNACFAQLTATSIGFTQPGSSTPAALFGAEGIETQRARLIAGPLIPCPQ